MVGNEAWIARVKVWIERDFPNLLTTGYEITSPDTIDYNCIAWAAEDNERWWWPDSQNIDYWPAGVPREVTINAFMQAYQTIGYELCDRPNLERGFQIRSHISLSSESGRKIINSIVTQITFFIIQVTFP